MQHDVKGHPGLKKDFLTGAVINTNAEEIRVARERKKKLKEKDARIEQLETDVRDIKSLLEQIAGKLDD